MRQRSTPLAFMAFDVLSVEGEPVTSRPYRERRRILEGLELDATQWRTPAAFDDGEALWTAVCEHEGVNNRGSLGFHQRDFNRAAVGLRQSKGTCGNLPVLEPIEGDGSPRHP